ERGALANDAYRDEHADDEHHSRWEPQPYHKSGEPRPEQDEVSVSRRHVIADVLIGFAREQHLTHLPAQLARQLDLRGRDSRVLTGDAAELVGKREIACLELRVR